MLLCDFHTHSTYSDGQLELHELIDFYGKRGFRALAVTDHLCEEKTFLGRAASFLNKSLTKRSFDRYLLEIKAESRRAWIKYGMRVIPGVEITKNSFSHADSAHILCLNIQEYIDPDLSIEEICDKAHEQGGITVAAHPVSTHRFEHQTFHLWHHRQSLKKYFDAWEVASGPNLFDEVFKSGLPMLANSDLHKPSQVTSWKTIIYGECTIPDILEKIINQKLGFYFYKESKYECSKSERLKISGVSKLLESSKILSGHTYC